MAAGLGDPSLLQYHDPVRTADRRQTVGYYDCGPPTEHPVEGPFDDALSLRIDRRCGFIENEDPRLSKNYPGECHQLALTGRKLDPAFADLGVQSVGKSLDEGRGPDRRSSSSYFLFGSIGPGEGDVLGNRSGEQKAFLGDYSHLAAKRTLSVATERLAVDQYFTLLGVVKPGDQLRQG